MQKKLPPNAGKGRPKGATNKTTKGVKLAIEAAFKGIGGVANFTRWAAENQTEFYKIYAKLIPQELKHSGSDDADARPVRVVFEEVRASDFGAND